MSTQRLAILKAVFSDDSTPVRSIPTAQPLTLPQFASGHIFIECVNADGSPHSLAYDTLLWGVRRHPTDAAPAIELQATNLDTDPDGNPADNWARLELIPGHWVNVLPRLYEHSARAVVAGNTDDFPSVVPSGQLKVTNEDVHPGDLISLPPTGQPLAPGPKGDTGATGPAGANGAPGAKGDDGLTLTATSIKTADYNAIVGDFVLCDPTGGGFAITLPNGPGFVVVKNDSDSENTITVQHPTQTIDGAAAYLMTTPRQAAWFISDGTAWRAF